VKQPSKAREIGQLGFEKLIEEFALHRFERRFSVFCGWAHGNLDATGRIIDGPSLAALRQAAKQSSAAARVPRSND
jgi:hypothetical protein